MINSYGAGEGIKGYWWWRSLREVRRCSGGAWRAIGGLRIRAATLIRRAWDWSCRSFGDERSLSLLCLGCGRGSWIVVSWWVSRWSLLTFRAILSLGNRFCCRTLEWSSAQSYCWRCPHDQTATVCPNSAKYQRIDNYCLNAASSDLGLSLLFHFFCRSCPLGTSSYRILYPVLIGSWNKLQHLS